MFYRIWAVSLILLAAVILWPSPSARSKRSPTGRPDDHVKWLVLQVNNNLLLDKFNRTLGSLNFQDDVLYFNSYTYKLFYNRDSINVPDECIIHEHSDGHSSLLSRCLAKSMRSPIGKCGKAFLRWYGISLHFSYDSALDMLNLLDDYKWIDSSFDPTDYEEYDVRPYSNDTQVPYNVLVPEVPTTPIPNTILNPLNSQICLAPNVCANLTTDCLYYPAFMSNVTVNSTYYISNSKLLNNQSFPTISLDCTNTTDLSQDILNYNPALYAIKQPITRCCNQVVLKSPPVVNNKDETKFTDKSSSSPGLSAYALYFILNLI